ncbi:M56 family metallopeptidase [Desulfosporosinus sp. PR]|uniref:M56 family metallopeptidase n=1 Tax=Candidatus Desulfosporosinus nitrosoreducens TaxID=3401928 RepID=UPI0027EB52B1|nr:M56 family metallopeptidase [Desulfosporosinus sp. PR]MDQ7092146.1 M56 family metallopeptidase [Desulfosporosinus sp. PR]
MSLTDLFHLFLSLSLSGSILALGLLFIKALFKQKLSANWHYYLWIILILRLLLPFTPPSPLNVFNFLPSSSTITRVLSQAPSAGKPLPDNTFPAPAPENSSKGDLQPASETLPAAVSSKVNVSNLAIIWLSGISLILVYVIFVNGWLFLRVNRQPLYKTKEIEEILEESKMLLKMQAKVSLVYDTGPRSPSLFGWLRPKIMISPQIISKLSREELKYIFLHELSHLKRRDLWSNALITLVQIVYWFNPIIWYALHQIKLDCEIACDATALSAVKPEEHKKYAQTIIDLMQLLSEPRWLPGTIGFINKFNTRRIIMISSFKKTTMKWTLAALALTLVVGCSSLSAPTTPSEGTKNQSSAPPAAAQQNPTTGTASNSNPTATTPSSTSENNSSNSSPGSPSSQSAQTLLSAMMQSAQQGKVINSDFPVKTTVIEDIEKVLGPADSTNYVAAAKGRYATFSSHNLVFGINKGEQIFEVRSFDSRLSGISLTNVKSAFGTPAYDAKYNGQEIIGYTAGPAYKIEMVFPQPTTGNPNPVMDHYSVLYPQGTVNSMADDPGRQW